MTHKLLVGAALAVTAAPLVRKYSVSRHSRGFSSSESSVSSPSSPPSSSQPAGGPAAALREYAQRVIAWGKWRPARESSEMDRTAAAAATATAAELDATDDDVHLDGDATATASAASAAASAASAASASGGVVTVVAAAGPSARRLSGGAAGHTENFAPQVIQRLAKEVRELSRSPPDGVAFVPNDEETLMEVHADITGPEGTPYEGGAFRLKLCIAPQFPHAPPRAFFLTRIYHPNVGPAGDVCVNTLKKDWQPHYTLAHTLAVVRCLLIAPYPESALNDEAGRLFLASYEQYARRARLYTEVHARRRGAGGGAGARASASASAGAGSGSPPCSPQGKGGKGGGGGGEEGEDEEGEGEEGAGAAGGGKLGRAQGKGGEGDGAGGGGSGGGGGKAPSLPLKTSSASSAAAKDRNKDGGAASSRRKSLKRL